MLHFDSKIEIFASKMAKKAIFDIKSSQTKRINTFSDLLEQFKHKNKDIFFHILRDPPPPEDPCRPP